MRRLTALTASLGLFAISACGTADEAADAASDATEAVQGAIVGEEVTATADVVAVQAESRNVTLRSEEGDVFTVVAGPEVRNFDQIEPGDRVNITYIEAIAANIAEPGSLDKTGEVSAAVSRAELGDKPAGSIVEQATTTVTIDEVDLETNEVTFTDQAGIVDTIEVMTPEMQEFIKTLKPGDKVDVTFSRALAIAVTPHG